MIAYQEDCLDAETIRDLLCGKMPDDRFHKAIAHLDSCETCRIKAESKDDVPLGSIFEKLDELKPSFEAEPQCVAAIQDIVVNRPPGIATPSLERLGSYGIVGLIGIGGMGSVYLAEHDRLRRKVAIKILPAEKLRRTGWLERFNREMTSIAALEHPNVVRALDAGEDNDVHYLVMEYLDGLDIGRVVRRLPEISIANACEIARQAALGLQAIHDEGMVHRDVKPSNLFLTRSGLVKLLDLGLVLDGESPVEGDERLTTVGHLMGTLPYMPREQLSDSSQVDLRADLYSLGATLFRLLTGRTPFGRSDNLAQTIQRIHTEESPTLLEVRQDVPPELSQLVTRLLCHDPVQRPNSASEVAEELDAFSGGNDLNALLRVAEKQQDEFESQSLPFSLANANMRTGGQIPRRWSWWLLAFLPVAMFAGILLTLATDSGDLVIRSELDDVNIVVREGENVVERLTVDASGDSSIRLWSGRYEIEIANEDSDRVMLDKRQVSILRGEDEVVSISLSEPKGGRETLADSEILRLGVPKEIEIPGGFDSAVIEYPDLLTLSASSENKAQIIGLKLGSSGIQLRKQGQVVYEGYFQVLTWDEAKSMSVASKPSTASGGRIFKGEDFAHWLSVLSREQDSSTLAGAMEAVSLLAESNEEQLAAAKEMLRPARMHGGIVFSRRSNASQLSTGPEYSQWYMSDLKDWLPKFPLGVQLRAIQHELKEGNSRSAIACVMCLMDVTTEKIRDAVNATGDVEVLKELRDLLREAIAGWQQQHSTLNPNSQEAAPLPIAWNNGIHARIRLWMASDPAQGYRVLSSDPQILDWALSSYAKEKETFDRWLGGDDVARQDLLVKGSPPSTLDPVTAMVLCGALHERDIDERVICFGLLNSWEFPRFQEGSDTLSARQEAVREATLRTIHKFDNGKTLAEATLCFLDWQAKTSAQASQFSNTAYLATVSDNIALLSTESLFHHPDPVRAIQVIVRIKAGGLDLPGGYATPLLDEVLDRLIVRLATETKNDDPESESKRAYAIRSAYHRGLEIPLTNMFTELRNLERNLTTDDIVDEEWPNFKDGLWGPEQTVHVFPNPDAHVRHPKPVEVPLWNVGTTFHYLRKYCDLRPELVMPAAISELKNGNTTSRIQIAFVTSLMYDGEHRPQLDTWRTYLESSNGKSQLIELARLFADADALHGVKPEVLFALGFDDTEVQSAEERTQDMMFADSIAFTQSLGVSPVSEASKWLVDHLVQQSERSLEAAMWIDDTTQLAVEALSLLPGETEEFKLTAEQELNLLLRIAYSRTPCSKEVGKFVRSVYRSQPDAFREFFLTQIGPEKLEAFAGFNAVRFQEETEHAWMIILRNLIEDQPTRAAIQQQLGGLLEQKSLKQNADGSSNSQDSLEQALLELLEIAKSENAEKP